MKDLNTLLENHYHSINALIYYFQETFEVETYEINFGQIYETCDMFFNFEDILEFLENYNKRVYLAGFSADQEMKDKLWEEFCDWYDYSYDLYQKNKPQKINLKSWLMGLRPEPLQETKAKL